MKIAIFCPNWVGDLVMATPALRAVRTHYRQAEIVGVMRPHLVDVLAGTNLIDRAIFHDPHNGNSAYGSWAVSRTLRYEQCDLGLLFTNSFRTALVAWGGNVERRVGFARDVRSWLLTDALPTNSRKTPHPVIHDYWRLATSAGCTGGSPRGAKYRLEAATSARDDQQFEKVLKRVGKPNETKGLVCLNTGGAFGAAKDWPTASFAELARLIADRYRKQVIVLCGPSERQAAREIVRLAGHRHVASLANETPSLALTKAAIKRSDLLITTDSGPRHFAAPFNVPVITLFGPTHIQWSETFYPKSTHLQLDVDCGPCQQRVCPLKHHRCMQELTVSRVFAAVSKYLEPSTRPAVA